MNEIIPDGWSIVGIGDFNGDGLSDLLLRAQDGTVTDWLAQPDGSFSDNTTNLNITVPTDWHIVGPGDFNGDVRSDVLWQNTDGTVTDWLGRTDGTFSGNGANLSVMVGAQWQVAAIGDFNGDGIDDVLWHSTDGTTTDWLGRSDGTFAGNAANFSINLGAQWSIVGTGDVDGDGRADILFRNSDGTITDWLGRGDGSFAGNGAVLDQVVDTGLQVAGVGDFNGDGKADILWRAADGTITDWLGQANGGFVDNSAAASQYVNNELQVAGVGDFNGDGRSDVLWQATDGTLQTWVGASNGAILSPVEKEWQTALGNVAGFTAHISANLNFRPDDSSSTAFNFIPLTDKIGGVFDRPGASLGDSSDMTNYTILDDLTFNIIASYDSGLSADFDGNFGSIELLDDSTNTFQFDMNGLDLIGTYHDGPPPADLDTSPDAIIITAPRISSSTTDSSDPTPTGYFFFDPNESGLNFNDGFGGGGSGGGGGAASLFHSQAGNLWASAHLNLLGKTQADVHTLNVMHDALAQFYDWATKNPNAPIQIGGSLTVPASIALQDFNLVTVNIQSTGSGPYGGQFQPNTTGGGTIVFNPENSTLASEHSWYGDSIYTFGIFHELGHQLDNANAQSMYNSLDAEGYADTAARSMENYLHIPLPQFPNNTPPDGYK